MKQQHKHECERLSKLALHHSQEVRRLQKLLSVAKQHAARDCATHDAHSDGADGRGDTQAGCPGAQDDSSTAQECERGARSAQAGLLPPEAEATRAFGSQTDTGHEFDSTLPAPLHPPPPVEDGATEWELAAALSAAARTCMVARNCNMSLPFAAPSATSAKEAAGGAMRVTSALAKESTSEGHDGRS